ncbi:hypothetical protein SAMN06265375_104199 [Muriicola jejuensis]|uniref:DNA primase n=1 Tax=Muriicola jejuensis TaxID=504488 RepID=A0A6P0UHA1_9FLAO|nr:hypothetical protein [Muriicola jejuensis]NER11209.1 hypothetical protein [Muriicola jejuensis]SMP24257.1 hypothetical protein SAMN06265375_104199 [Muriicola jejuensis]
MKRILIDHKKLDHTLAARLVDTYPDGYGDDDIISFRNHKGEYIEAVELRTEDALYLVKISQSLSHFIANFEVEDEDEADEMVKPVTEEPELELNLESELEEEEFD